MLLGELQRASEKAVGTRETRKALDEDRVVKVFIARDAEEYVVRPVIDVSQQRGLDIVYVDSMSELGKACGISVGAASAGILR
ncbi:MAG: ribosomal L7Ae/L30e/S12e/Gadd45 family protein [Bacillota bacterium]